MAKALFVCRRAGSFTAADERQLAAVCRRLEPDNLQAHPAHRVHVGSQVAYAIIGDAEAVAWTDNAVLLGRLIDGDGEWTRTGGVPGDGSFALFRADADVVEVESDPAGSRTVWYYHDPEWFIAATSQRAIAMFLGSFQFDRRVIAWVLSTGTLGPVHAWDARVQRLPPDARLRLDRRMWELGCDSRPVRFTVQPRSRDEHKQRLRAAIEHAFAGLDRATLDQWALPLSGGHDSRAILCFLLAHGGQRGLRTLTWGLQEALADHGSDAWVAKELARVTGVANEYCATDVAEEPIEHIVNRFLLCGEGRIDHVSGYMDGLELWRALVEDRGVQGVLRGDEGFGWCEVSSERTVRLAVGCPTCHDFDNLAPVIDAFGFPAQELPAELQRHASESLQTWRDRLYHAFRIPTVLAALADVKLAYVEQAAPLLSRAILQAVREQPDALRGDKRLFRELVAEVSPPVPYASRGANADRRDLFQRADMVALMRPVLASAGARELLGEDFMRFVLDGLRIAEPKPRGALAGLKATLQAALPRRWKNRMRDSLAPPLVPGNVLAFRVFLILRMHECLRLDAEQVTRDLSDAVA